MILTFSCRISATVHANSVPGGTDSMARSNPTKHCSVYTNHPRCYLSPVFTPCVSHSSGIPSSTSPVTRFRRPSRLRQRVRARLRPGNAQSSSLDALCIRPEFIRPSRTAFTASTPYRTAPHRKIGSAPRGRGNPSCRSISLASTKQGDLRETWGRLERWLIARESSLFQC